MLERAVPGSGPGHRRVPWPCRTEGLERHIEEALAGAEMGPLPEEALAELRQLYAAPLR